MAKLSVVRTAVERSPKRTMATMSSTRLMPESSARADERNRWSMVTSPQCGHVGLCIGRHAGDLEIHPGGACPARDEAPRREGTPGGLVLAVLRLRDNRCCGGTRRRSREGARHCGLRPRVEPSVLTVVDEEVAAPALADDAVAAGAVGLRLGDHLVTIAVARELLDGRQTGHRVEVQIDVVIDDVGLLARGEVPAVVLGLGVPALLALVQEDRDSDGREYADDDDDNQ